MDSGCHALRFLLGWGTMVNSRLRPAYNDVNPNFFCVGLIHLSLSGLEERSFKSP